ncbi:hypothetical protein LP421_26240 [Rhizobium sp. RCAM05350]|nr:hypothetical protein LP421_26240 [Rhizobium sp. RCAM05350]
MADTPKSAATETRLKSGKPTLRTIADLTGFAVTTVSRAEQRPADFGRDPQARP